MKCYDLHLEYLNEPIVGIFVKPATLSITLEQGKYFYSKTFQPTFSFELDFTTRNERKSCGLRLFMSNGTSTKWLISKDSILLMLGVGYVDAFRCLNIQDSTVYHTSDT